MDLREIKKLSRSATERVVTPLKEPIIVKKPTILAYDSEYKPNGELLSAQWAGIKRDKITSRIYWIEYTDTKKFFSQLQDFLGYLRIKPSGKKTIYVVCHFTPADLSKIRDWARIWHVRKFTKGLNATLTVAEDKLTGQLTFGITPRLQRRSYSTGLKKIAEGLGNPLEDFDHEKMPELYTEDRKRFERIAKRDAVVTLKAFLSLRKLLVGKYQVDPLVYPTMASVALAIFRHKYQRAIPSPWKYVEEVRRRKAGNGYKNQIIKKVCWKS
jgi:hypothetical protein